MFTLAQDKEVRELSIYVSTRPPGAGLWPDDALPGTQDDTYWKIQKSVDDVLDGDFNRNRILTLDVSDINALPPGLTFDAATNTFTLDSSKLEAFRLTAAQEYFWGVEVKTNDNKTFRKYQPFKVAPVTVAAGLFPAVTVVTHGFQPPLYVTPDVQSTDSMAIARSIVERSGGTIMVLNKQKGEFERVEGHLKGVPPTLGQPLVLVMDWVLESGISDSGFSEAAADALFAALVRLDQALLGAVLESPMHFIGHSRGTSVNSEVIQRLGVSFPEVRNIHMTTLDPHEFVQPALDIPIAGALSKVSTWAQIASIASAASSLAVGPAGVALALKLKAFSDSLTSMSNWANLLGLGTVGYADFRDPMVQVWSNVGFADNYYQTLGLREGFTMTPNGRYIDGAHNLLLDGRALFEIDASLFGVGLSLPHSRVQNWYHGTANLSLDKGNDLLGIFANPVWRTIANWRDEIEGDLVAKKGVVSLSLDGKTDYAGQPGMAWYRWGELDNVGGASSSPSVTPFESDRMSWEGVGTGWAWSVLGGADDALWSEAGRPSATRNPNLTDGIASYSYIGQLVPTVFNGSFDQSRNPIYGRFPVILPTGTWTEIPGWSFHGGSGGALQGVNLGYRLSDGWINKVEIQIAEGLISLGQNGLNDIAAFTSAFLEKLALEAGSALGSGLGAAVVLKDLPQTAAAVVLALALDAEGTIAEFLKMAGISAAKSISVAKASEWLPKLAQYIFDEVVDYSAKIHEETPLTHNWMYFGADYDRLQLDVKIARYTNGSSSLKAVFEDVNNVFHEVMAFQFPPAMSSAHGDFFTVAVDIPAALRGSVGRFTLMTHNPDKDPELPYAANNPLVEVDNIRLIGTHPLHAGASGDAEVDVLSLDDAALEPLVQAAILKWGHAGFDAATLALLGKLSMRFDALPAGVLGKTYFHNDGGVEIVLSLDGAGRGWFVDPTPFDSDEYARQDDGRWLYEGDDAHAGRYDLLTVLMHEMGHALGLRDMAGGGYAHDLMSSTLVPDVRRFPAGYSPLGTAGQGAAEAATATATAPAIQYVLMNTIARGEQATAAAPAAQFAFAAHPTLTNADFGSGEAWAVNGRVQMQAGAATLHETATSHTRLNQAFVIGENDRYLSFTLADIALDDVDHGPDDAFEVALIDADTGLSLLGNTGLGRSDAALNLQADGTEHRAQEVTTVRNGDGSITVLVDLSGVAAGTVVHLSFDLIGFGRGAAAESSRVTVRDLVLGLPTELQALDDVATVAMGASIDIDVLANDPGAQRPGVVPVLVSGPAQGQVEITAEGGFRYQAPDDWHGEASFSYRLTDGGQVSNIAIVRIAVTALNSAPVANSLSLSLQQDATVVIDLAANATDADGDSLQITVGSPMHGDLVDNGDGSWTYRPHAGFHGVDRFDWFVSDGRVSTAATVSLEVIATQVEPRPPVAIDDDVELDEDRSIVIRPLDNDLNVSGELRQLTLVRLPEHGVLVDNGDFTFTYTPVANWSGEDGFAYVISVDGLQSGQAQVRLQVNAVADAPVLVVTDEYGPAREVFVTGWESAPNPDRNASVVRQPELEGWRPVTGAGAAGAQAGFVVWSTLDRAPGADGRLRALAAKSGNGANWVELSNRGGTQYPSSGIERSVHTVEGARYVLTLDLAGALGFTGAQNQIGIYVDGVRIGGHDGVSSLMSLNWQSAEFAFVGSGGVQTVRIVAEGSLGGMMVDNLRLSEALPPNTGHEDGEIRLSALHAGLVDVDGSETLRLRLAGLPAGATVSDGAHSLVVGEDGEALDITGWARDALRVLPPADFHGRFEVLVQAVATEIGNGSTAITEARIAVTVLPLNDAPIVRSVTLHIGQDGRALIDFAALATDVDGDMLVLSIGQPAAGTLSRNADGTYTYVPVSGFSGEDVVSFTVSDGRQCVSGRVTLVVAAGGAASAEVTVSSGFATNPMLARDAADWIVINQGKPRGEEPAAIDWNGASVHLGDVYDAQWIAQYFLADSEDALTLADITGLRCASGEG
ncbi:tandem-95 repeat protein [Thauera sp.]